MTITAYSFPQMLKIFVAFVTVFAVISTVRELRKRREWYGYIENVISKVRRPTLQEQTYLTRSVDPVKGGDTFRIAVGGAMTAKGLTITQADQVRSLPIFWQFLPHFCNTASVGFEYHFYFGYDDTGVLANETILAALDEHFRWFMTHQCGDLTIAGLHMVTCEHTGKPAWAQNDAMMQAYLDGMDFFYRLNDDTAPISAHWTEAFIEALSELDPPFVGVVGPTCNIEPADIISHDFVHRTHIEIFGFYYPRAYPDWYADTWMTYVYKPERSVKLHDVIVQHSETLGRRYHVAEQGLDVRERVHMLAANYSGIIQRYISQFLSKAEPQPEFLNPRVVSLSLYGSNPRYTFGAIRNAQLVQLIYPSWQLRIYYHPKSESSLEYEHLHVPDNVLETLEVLEVALFPVTERYLLREPSMWRHLVFDDYENVEYAIIRNADSRINVREARLVNEWLSSKARYALHCIRDHPEQGITPLMDGLWGGKSKSLRMVLNRNITSLVYEHIGLELSELERLHHTNHFLMSLWTGIRNEVYCHDSVTCQLWDNSHPAKRLPAEQGTFVGQRFDGFEDGFALITPDYMSSPECVDD